MNSDDHLINIFLILIKNFFNTTGYSGADMKNLCTEAAHGPLRNISMTQIRTVSTNEVRPIIVDDFEDAMNQVKASVSQSDLNAYFEWDKSFGSNSSKKK
jgi:SpoVK/Ycf46/Vps4 family AAA+-type ATPase